MKFQMVYQPIPYIQDHFHLVSRKNKRQGFFENNDWKNKLTLYNASRHKRKAPCPNRGKSATALNTKSLLHAIMGIWVSIFEQVDDIFGSPCVKRISVIICNDVSQLIGSPKSTIAKNNND